MKLAAIWIVSASTANNIHKEFGNEDLEILVSEDCEYWYGGPCSSSKASMGIGAAMTPVAIPLFGDTGFASWNAMRDALVTGRLGHPDGGWARVASDLMEKAKQYGYNVKKSNSAVENCSMCNREKDVGHSCWWCGH